MGERARLEQPPTESTRNKRMTPGGTTPPNATPWHHVEEETPSALHSHARSRGVPPDPIPSRRMVGDWLATRVRESTGKERIAYIACAEYMHIDVDTG